MRVDWLDAADVPLIDALRGSPVALESEELAALFERAELHGILGVLHDACSNGVRRDERAGRMGGAAIPSELARMLGARAVARELDHQAHVAMLRRVDAVLAEASLTAVALKGVLLGERYYPRPSSRATSDIDLLVAEDDLERAAEALSGVGYRGFDGPSERRFRREHHHLHFEHPHAPPLELHFHAYRGFGSILRSEPLLRRSRTHADWKAVRVLEPADELLYLAVHAAAHRFVRIGWLFDLKLLLGGMSPRDVARAHERAHDVGYARVVSFALGLVADAFGGPEESASLGSWRAPLARRVVRERGRPLFRSASRFLYTATLCDSVPATLSYATWASRGYARRLLGLDR